jgi:hypothetical protein
MKSSAPRPMATWKKVGIVVFIVAAFVIFFRYQTVSSELAALRSNPAKLQELTAEEQKKLIVEVAKLMELPTSEAPTIATVADPSRLSGQSFFINAKAGDRVLIYATAKKAILYRPKTHKIIEVGPINITGTSVTPTPQPQPITSEYTVVLYNGTQEVGLTNRFDAQLKVKAPTLKISDRSNASNRNYPTSLVVDVKGDKKSVAEQLAALLGMTVAPLPADESTPSSDFLIILGNDKK